MNKAAEQNASFPSGEWSGYYLEGRPGRGWMHLFLSFENGQITGEGTDRVGPWHIRGTYDEQSGQCNWVKQYLGKHEVVYFGQNQNGAIVGDWNISNYLEGPFKIWPKGHADMESEYLQEQAGTPQAF